VNLTTEHVAITPIPRQIKSLVLEAL